MKKIFMILVAAMMMVGTLQAKVIMTESFERETGTLNMGPNTSMGTNTDDWWSYSGSSNYIKVEEGTLSYPGYMSTGKGNKSFLWSTGADDFRQFSAVTSGKLYASAIINVNALKQGTISDYFFCFGDATASNMYARLYSKSVKDDGGNFIGFQLGIAKFSETNTYVRFTKDVYAPNTNYLVVIEYEFVEGDKNDIARLYVNPTKATTAATLECVQDTLNSGGNAAGANSKNDASKISSINLRQGTNTPKEVYIDEIKVATSWTELFEEGGEDPSPAINVASSVDFGAVTINEAAEKTITVKGSYLKGAINVASSSALVVPAVSTISKDAAEASSGYALKLTLTATEVGAGSANITLSSTEATSQVVKVSWNAAAPAAKVANIAALKGLAAWDDPVDLESQPVVIRVTNDGAAIQDASGAMFIVDAMGDFVNLKAGNKVALGGLQMIEAEYGVEGYPTAYSGSINVLSSGNTLEPIEVTIAELDQYGPAYVKVSGVTFPDEAEKFAAGNIAISQSGTSVNLYILAGNNIIGEDVPASADVQGCVMNWYGLKLQISSSADVFNRVPKGGEAGGDNLILNHSFEEYSCNMFGCQFEEWNMALGCGSANSTDKLDGSNSLMINASNMATVLDQGVALTDADYAKGAKFTLTLNYKVQTMPEDATLALDCYWEAAAGGDSEATEAHESEILRANLEKGSGWMSKELVTTKPAKSSNFRVRVKVPKSAKVLFDNFSLYYTPSADPFIEVSPAKLNAVETTIGNTATFQTVHIRQGNLSGKTTFYVGGKDASQFSLSASELAADQSDLDLIITYAPTSAGTHSASLIFDNAAHTTILPDMISLSGSCTDPSAKPTLTVTPSTLPGFEVVEGKQQKKVVTLSSINCTDFVYARVEHISPAEHGAFTIDGSMFGKNSEATVTITFAPIEAGTYQSTLTFYTEGAENVTVTLNGTCTAKTPETIDWQTSFVWNETNPLSWMYEKFESVKHNETLILDGWQNVADINARPWWGFDEAKTSPVRGEDTYAKATAYQYGKDSTALWNMWLVTPALDYKKAASKIFAFSVMGEYLADEGNKAQFSVYYIDATGAEIFVQDLTSSFEIPSTSSDNLAWRTFFLDLEPYAETMSDVFHMAFRYTSPNGGDGVVTYYVDDISWGRTDLPTLSVTPATIIDSTAVINQKKSIGTIAVSGKNLTNGITLKVEGSNYNRFSLSAASLPAEGGSVEVSFEGKDVGVHEAYVRISSKGAPDKFVPMAVLCKDSETGVEAVMGDGLQVTGHKLLRDGQIIILRDGKAFNVLGVRL
jgi:hypothetical protein